jgi:heme O synthase-like polyprenyltransferase
MSYEVITINYLKLHMFRHYQQNIFLFSMYLMYLDIFLMLLLKGTESCKVVYITLFYTVAYTPVAKR